MHGAIGAFLCEIPATSRFSASFESSFLEIQVHYPVAPTKNTLEKPKKKVPPSKVRCNRQRLMKFLEKCNLICRLLPTRDQGMVRGHLRHPPLRALNLVLGKLPAML